ncbi:acyl-CoA dehydrogenase family protein [Jannaschia rubra]|uniref:Acyl-CoA dehydrogenase fadE12 n=1 Tax=Jannaschia rubra TaxID=282197 RepID=A0A0M6XT28_9RHOB|nr:acyl-CoA dehydrogenase family protein [Jannaschia rubra]CTQ33325.1 Acyl-CoA dehydrogenase fadE12 [Jannaschia rubra]SFF99249.1 Acyl-CoA dehydrogenase, N-terminal domain [Jannaschia rubra]
MNFDLSDESRMLQDGLRRLLSDRYDRATRDAARDAPTGFVPEVWAALAEMGVIGALFPEDAGGFGGTGFDIAVVFEELGRAGAVDPLIDTGVLGGGLLAAFGQGDMLEGVIEGSVQLAFAHGEPGSRYDLSRVETTARRDGDGWVLSGRKAVVVNAPAADHVIVSARTSGEVADRDGISLFLVPAGALDIRAYPLVGGGAAAEIALDDLRAGELLGPEGGAFDAIATASARATLAICAEALGLMETIRGLTTDYLRTRKQFGQPIGKFQVLQHRMADVLIEIEQARSAVINLAGNIDGDDRDRHVSAAKNLIGNAARLVVEESIQMHGGIGMTEEYDLAHLAKRLTMVDHRFGDTLHHLDRFIALSAA